MNWLFELHRTQPIAHAVDVLAFVCLVGMALGSAKVKGVGLGTASVLFAAILVGHFGKVVDHHTLDFVKEFGLILFVFTIGLQLGPGFFAALQQQGVKLNVLAAVMVLLGAAGAPLAGWPQASKPRRSPTRPSIRSPRSCASFLRRCSRSLFSDEHSDPRRATLRLHT
jgi:putative transport protein